MVFNSAIEDGLERVKKTHQLAELGMAIQVGFCRLGSFALPNSGKPEFGGTLPPPLFQPRPDLDPVTVQPDLV
jgi:hypothetical protein